MARHSLMERLRLAELQRPSIMSTREGLQDHAGSSTEELEQLGLGKQDLKRLERMGLAIRARTKNIWVPGETLPSGKEVEAGCTYRGKGSRIKWLLLK